MRILAFDTSTSSCSVALWQDGQILARRFEEMARGQSEHLMPLIQEVLQEGAFEFSDLDLLAVTVGPGAFTGIRIGLAAARGIALAAQLPSIGITTMEAVAQGIPEDEYQDGRQARTLLVAMESKREDVYVQAFTPDLEPPYLKSTGDIEALLPGDLDKFTGPILLAGDAAPRVLEAMREKGISAELSSAPSMPDAAVLAGLAAVLWSPEKKQTKPRPLYLRPPDAVRPKNGGRLRP